jgi:hypothetical protein
MRRKDLSGAHEWMGAEELMRSLIVCKLSARKISVSCKFVMRRVFEGGVGCVRGGMVERSIESGVRDSLEVGRDDCGELWEDISNDCRCQWIVPRYYSKRIRRRTASSYGVEG